MRKGALSVLRAHRNINRTIPIPNPIIILKQLLFDVAIDKRGAAPFQTSQKARTVANVSLFILDRLV